MHKHTHMYTYTHHYNHGDDDMRTNVYLFGLKTSEICFPKRVSVN